MAAFIAMVNDGPSRITADYDDFFGKSWENYSDTRIWLRQSLSFVLAAGASLKMR
jgi:hypothetical protein